MSLDYSSSGFGYKSRVITPSANPIDPVARSVVMLTAGSITVQPIGNATGDVLVFGDLPAGYVIPFFIRHVTACSGTCATID